MKDSLQLLKDGYDWLESGYERFEEYLIGLATDIIARHSKTATINTTTPRITLPVNLGGDIMETGFIV